MRKAPSLLSIYCFTLPVSWFFSLSLVVFLACFVADFLRSAKKARFLLLPVHTDSFVALNLLLLFLAFYFLRVFFVPLENMAVSPSRVLSSIQGGISWLAVFLVIFLTLVYKQKGVLRSDYLQKAIKPNLIACVIFGAVSIFVYVGFDIARLQTPFLSMMFGSLLERLPAHLVALSEATFYSKDWLLGGYFPRLRMLSPYANGLAGFFILLLALYFISANKISIKYLLLFLPMIVLTMSRTVVLAIVIALLIVYVIYFLYYLLRLTVFGKVKNNVFYNMIVIVFTAAVMVASGVFLFEYFMSYRSGSTSTRLASYAIAFSHTSDANLLFGIGYKLKSTDSVISIGSHSTPVGVFMKTGLIGLVLYMFLWGWLLYCALRNYIRSINISKSSQVEGMLRKNGVVLCAMLIVFMWQLSEDLDAQLHVPVLLGALIAEMLMFSKALTLSRNMTDNKADL